MLKQRNGGALGVPHSTHGFGVHVAPSWRTRSLLSQHHHHHTRQSVVPHAAPTPSTQTKERPRPQGEKQLDRPGSNALPPKQPFFPTFPDIGSYASSLVEGMLSSWNPDASEKAEQVGPSVWGKGQVL